MEENKMNSLKALGIIGTGGLGVLAAGLIVSKILETGTEGIFGLALVVFVVAGAVALVVRAMH
jgi:hypothetical protein